MLCVKSSSVVEYKATESSRGKERKHVQFCCLYLHNILANFPQRTPADLQTTPLQCPISPSLTTRWVVSVLFPDLALVFVSGCDLGGIQVEHFMCSVRSFKWRKLLKQ